jgi:hypothetical protein
MAKRNRGDFYAIVKRPLFQVFTLALLLFKRFFSWLSGLRKPKRYTLGFRPGQLAQHFSNHHAEFPSLTEAKYGERADRYLGGPLDTNVLECDRTRPDGTRGAKIRYNTVTQEYGILGVDNHIRSYYIAGPKTPTNPRGHRFPTNLDYYNWDCRRIKW